jgi:prepilin-type N-terminal cleavage/methylation domain-containing protein
MRIPKENNGFSLLELLIALVIAGMLLAAFYRTFIGGQEIYTIQEEVVDMQQNVRMSIDQIVRKIRMAGCGGNILSFFGSVNGFSSIITPVNNANNVGTNDDVITILVADQVSNLTSDAAKGSSQMTLSNASSNFNTGAKKYLCLNGQNNYVVQNVSENTVTLASTLAEDHRTNEIVYLVKAITYKLQWDATDGTVPVLVMDEHTGLGPQVLAENIENLQSRYTLSDGTVTDSPANAATIRMVKIDITARTRMRNPQLPGDGYRRRELNSFVNVRNLGL